MYLTDKNLDVNRASSVLKAFQMKLPREENETIVHTMRKSV